MEAAIGTTSASKGRTAIAAAISSSWASGVIDSIQMATFSAPSTKLRTSSAEAARRYWRATVGASGMYSCISEANSRREKSSWSFGRSGSCR